MLQLSTAVDAIQVAFLCVEIAFKIQRLLYFSIFFLFFIIKSLHRIATTTKGHLTVVILYFIVELGLLRH
jgi:hypothetical protein